MIRSHNLPKSYYKYIFPKCFCVSPSSTRRYYSSGKDSNEAVRTRTAGLGRAIEDEYAAIREKYGTSDLCNQILGVDAELPRCS